MTVSIESFLVLEKSLSNRLLNSWRRDAATTTREILELVNSGDFAAAVDVCEGLSLAAAAEENRRFVEFIGMQAALFGASRLSGDPRKSVFMDSGRPEEIKLAANNLIIMMEENATQSVCRLAIEMLGQEQVDQQEAAIQKADPVPFPRQFVSSIGKNGKGFIDIGSSLHTSRLASWGFTIEATARGIDSFQINEQLDGRTCPVCRTMHGRKFNVAQARTKLETWMSTTNPDDMKSVAPWPSQNKKNVSQLSQMSSSQIQDKGWDTPPYHPLCRGVLVRSGSITQVEPVQSITVPRDSVDMLGPLMSEKDLQAQLNAHVKLLVKHTEQGDFRKTVLSARGKLKEYTAARSAGTNTRGMLEDIASSLKLNKNGSRVFGNVIREPGIYGLEFETANLQLMHLDLLGEGRLAWRKFSTTTIDAMGQYVGINYRKINSALRGLAADVSEATAATIRTLKRSVSKWPVLEHDTILWRGGNLKLPSADSLIGSTMSDSAFTSTSLSERFTKEWLRGTAADDRVLYKITAKKGDRVLPMLNNTQEFEVLLPPNTKFRVMNVEIIKVPRAGDVKLLTVEVV
jgi:hypothetical protein